MTVHNTRFKNKFYTYHTKIFRNKRDYDLLFSKDFSYVLFVKNLQTYSVKRQPLIPLLLFLC